MEKLEHLATMFNRRTKRKDYENFIVNAIYNRVGNYELIPVTQQYVRSVDDSRKYYLMDLYFPQINYGIEVDEMQHTHEYHKILDEEREEAIREAIGCTERRIELYHKVEEGSNAVMRSFEEINSQIDEYVQEIKELIEEKKCQGKSIRWQSNEERKERVVKVDKTFDIEDDVEYKGATELYNLLNGRDLINWRRCSFRPNSDYIVWVPHLAVKDENGEMLGKDGWVNCLSNDRKTIIEIDTEDNLKASPERDFIEKRVVFMKMRDKYGKKCCKFIGVFAPNGYSEVEGHIERHYKRVATKISIADLQYHK